MGCVNPTLTTDFAVSSVDANYHSAEIITGRDHNFGIVAERADTYQPFVFSVAGIYKGTISVRSNECNFDESITYSQTGPVRFEVPVQERCLYQILVKPHFTAREAGGVSWRAISGVLLLRGNENALVKAVQIREDSHATINFNFITRTRLFLKGCGYQHDEWHEKGLVSLEVTDDYFGQARDCVLDGASYSDSGRRVPISILLSRYASDYIRLPVPEITYQGAETQVWADPSISILSRNKTSIFDNFATFVGPIETLRFYTAKGRYAFCVQKEILKCFR